MSKLHRTGRSRWSPRIAHRLTVLAACVAAVAVVALPAAAAPVTTVSEGGYSFVNYQLGDLPAEYCPDPNSPCNNWAAEPAIRADNFGNFFGVSENGITSGTEAWKSIDGGLHYVHLQSPNQLSIPSGGAAESGISPAGGDTDLATATAKNSFGIYNVYVASLEAISTEVSTSTDGGHTWTNNNLAGKFPGEDREWIAADGANKVCISYLSAAGVLVPTAGLHVECSYDAGTTFTQTGDAVELANADARVGMRSGNLAIDQQSNTSDPARNNDIVYATFVSGTVADATNPNPTGFHIVWMGVSLDGGRTFTDHQVYNDPDPTHDYSHNFTNVAVDKAGNVYSFFSDDHYVYYKYSTDHGTTWKPGGPSGAPIRISRTPANTAIFPWGTAGDAGKVDLVYYGTSYYGPEHPDNYPANVLWYVYFAQNLHATTAGSTWTQVRASPVNHRGAVCEGGVGCTGNRDLYDDFGVAARPSTGLASIIYSDDQRDQYNPNVTNPSHPTRCSTPADDNTSNCNHTSIATQTRGPGIFGTGTPPGGGGGGGGGGKCDRSSDSDKAERDAVDDINRQRAAAFLPPVTENNSMSDEARHHSCDEREHGDLSKRGSDGSLPADRISAAGVSFTTASENLGLATGATAGAALATINSNLVNDATSKANMLNPFATQVGVGVVYLDGVMWLTADLVG
jgi:uncharacterized protein YkwD